MAKHPFFYNVLDEAETNELRQRMDKAEKDTFKVYEICKIYKNVWRRQVYHLYQEIYGHELQIEVVGRALTDLCLMGYLNDTGETQVADKGARNKVYRLADVEPVNPIKIPRKICVPLQFKEMEDGSYELDLDAMSSEFIDKLNYYDNIFLTKTSI